MSDKKTNHNFQDLSQEGRQFVITLPEKLSADFFIRLSHEKINIRKFFRLMVEGYLSDDTRIVSYLDEAVKDDRPRYQTRILQKERKQVKEIKESFGLEPNEIEDIFDIIEEEYDI